MIIAAVAVLMTRMLYSLRKTAHEAKRLGNRFGSRSADLKKALDCIDKDTVMSAAEIKKVTGLVQRTKKESRKSGKVKSVISILDKRVGQVPTDSAVVKLVKQL